MLRNSRSARLDLRKSSLPKSTRVTATAQEMEFSSASASESDASESEVSASEGNGHSLRWNTFVSCKLQTLGGRKPEALPGVGPVYAKQWAAKGYKTALQVFAAFLRKGPKEFADYAAKEIGMRSNVVQDLVSGLESRWSSLTLVGSEKRDLQKNAQAEGDHSVRWGIFVNCKISDTELSDLPGMGPTYLAAMRDHGIKTPTQMIGEFVMRGRAGFDTFCQKEVGMRQIGRNDNVSELSSALEAKWNALTLFGTD